MSPENMAFWQRDYFELVVLRNSRHWRSSENRSYPLVRDTIYKESSIYKGVSLSVPGRKG